MPLKHSATKSATTANFHEVRHGRTFKRTARKKGKAQARKQMIAIVLENKRRAQSKKHHRKRVTGKR